MRLIVFLVLVTIFAVMVDSGGDKTNDRDENCN